MITGYALTFASLLIIGGRLGDVFGHRRIFMIGAALFGGGSLLAALSWGIPSLIVGEALIEGIGASLMLPTTLAVISTTFHGRERATAFAAWGATVGVGVALGPVVGGLPHHQLLVALGVRHQRDRGAARHRRRHGVHLPQPPAGAAHLDRRPRRDPRGERDVPLRVRAERGRPLRLVPAPAAVHPRRGCDLARRPRGVDHPAGDGPRRGRPLLLLPARAMEGAPRPQPAVRVRPAAPPGVPLRVDHDQRPGDGSARHVLRAAGLPAGRQAPLGRDQRAVDGAGRGVHHRGVPDRRASRPPRRGHPRRAARAGARGGRARRHRVRGEPVGDVPRPARSVGGCSASASASRARSSPT